jgi:hypothetical protein
MMLEDGFSVGVPDGNDEEGGAVDGITEGTVMPEGLELGDP